MLLQSYSQKIYQQQKQKNQITINKLVYLDLSILDPSKTVMHEFQFDYVKPKYGESAKLCFMDADSVIVSKTLQKMLK